MVMNMNAIGHKHNCRLQTFTFIKFMLIFNCQKSARNGELFYWPADPLPQSPATVSLAFLEGLRGFRGTSFATAFSSSLCLCQKKRLANSARREISGLRDRFPMAESFLRTDESRLRPGQQLDIVCIDSGALGMLGKSLQVVGHRACGKG